jgi:hypothetical protein
MNEPVLRHGIDCGKVVHLANRPYDHGGDDDKPFDIDGVEYCGRCHRWINEPIMPSATHEVRDLSLYHLTDDLQQLASERMAMGDDEDATEIDAAIQAYMAALPQKVDAVAAVLRHMASQEDLADAEIDRLSARKKRFTTARERLEGYAKDVLAALPAPKKGKTKRLEGRTSTLVLRPNGGLAPLVTPEDESIVPEEYCTATIKMPYTLWLRMQTAWQEAWEEERAAGIKVARELSNSAIRKALETDCWDCGGSGNQGDGPCKACGGSGKAGVPGCYLRERGSTLKIE